MIKQLLNVELANLNRILAAGVASILRAHGLHQKVQVEIGLIFQPRLEFRQFSN